MIVDDSLVFRTLLRETLGNFPEIEVVSQAVNGKLALPRIRHYVPDVLILDQEMPVMNGLETLEVVRKEFPEIRVIMFSAHTVQGAKVTIKALALGAYDFVTKPGSEDDPKRMIQDHLLPLVLSVKGPGETEKKRTPPEKPRAGRGALQAIHSSYSVAAIGISTGGPAALHQLLPLLPGGIRGSLLIVQHMPPIFTRQLADSLNTASRISVVEGEDGMEVAEGIAYIAPGGWHMVVDRKGAAAVIRIIDSPPELNCRPSANILFRSVAEIYGREAVGVIMTGMGDDGFKGMQEMRGSSGYLLAQEKESCLIFGMPSKPVEEGLIDEVLDIQGLAARTSYLLGGA